jgi:hypothetical protein
MIFIFTNIDLCWLRTTSSHIWLPSPDEETEVCRVMTVYWGEIEGNQSVAGPLMSLQQRKQFLQQKIRIWTSLKTHIEPFNILIVSAGENL